ncbi:YerC/YecD family TrpR-related protein [Sphingomicrobium arenosum]|uniref:YerC/YecD family TrpR-related protein n=1 Tax=Sphingomicrobium arenosum TaxID=2233861 RepID=UPI002240FBE6|nr:YerC/YecD family TrpR-related protein [Sphingomicrobium arenosum]
MAEIRERVAGSGAESPVEAERQLSAVLARLDDPAAIAMLLDDLCTPSERRALAERWHVARLLDEERWTYRQIHELTGVSTTTITRVARFLKGGTAGGYRTALAAMNEAATNEATIDRDEQ